MRILISLLMLMTAAVAKPVKVYLDWFVNPHHAPLVVGIQSGIFKRHGLEVELIAAGGSEEGARQVAAGQADLAVAKQSSHLIRVVNQGMPVVRVATLIDRPLECLIASPEIKTLKDLKGKRIGFTSSSIEFAEIVLTTMLRQVDLTLADVTLVPITSGMTASFLSGNVDAIFSAYRTYELLDIQQHKPKVNVFLYEDQGVPPYEQVILIAHRDHVEDQKALVAALREVVVHMKKNPEQAWQEFIKQAPEQNTSINHRVFDQVVELLVADPNQLNKKNYIGFSAFLQENKALKNTSFTLKTYAQEVLS